MASTREKRFLRGSRPDSGCVDLLDQSRAPSFPYFCDWSFDYQWDLNPKKDCDFLRMFAMIDMYYWVGANVAMAVLSQSYWSFNILSVRFIQRTKELEEHQSRRATIKRQEASKSFICFSTC
ncbi:hypothetical protein HA466_0097820 [Hirschfeldia incana]|nr:hypothetical protein HA466_0097820 [Hirschfeldia incana]